MADPLLIDLTTHESEGTDFAVLQRWIKQAVINAGISIPMSDPLLRDLTTYDSEGTRFAVLQRWLKLLANNLSGGGGGGTIVRSGTVNIVAGTQSYNISFGGFFVGTPSFFTAQVQMPNSSGESLDVTADLSTLSASGVTVWLSAIPTAASAGGKINWGASQ